MRRPAAGSRRELSVKPASAGERGRAAEALACRHLEHAGLRIVARNLRYRLGELDAVARDGPVWVFVEVRCRSRRGDAAASIDRAKRGRIRRAAQLFLQQGFGDRWPPCRFDVVLVEGATVRWLRDAFVNDEEM
jgi:putative endonuclease